jgi:hypothetical protein
VRKKLIRSGSIACLLFLGACNLVEDFNLRRDKPEPVLRDTGREAALVADYLKTLEYLTQGSPSRQAELAADVRNLAAVDPTIFNRLRHALVLAMPGHAASSPVAARDELGSLLATPELLLPAEVAIANVILHEVNARITLELENQRLAGESSRQEQSQVQTLTRRLQAQTAENARLRQELTEALAKLEAVATLERDLAERRNNEDQSP